MLGIEDYGSGSDSDGEGTSQRLQPIESKKSSISLPPPSSTKGPPKKKKTIAISLPTLKHADDGDDDDMQLERPPAKKAKAGTGAGFSSLLSMLPAPKQKAPVPSAPERVLGGGNGPGLVFNKSRPVAATATLSVEDEGSISGADEPTLEGLTSSSTSFAFRPPSVARGKANISLEEEKPRVSDPTSTMSADFFGLASTSSSSSSISKSSVPSSSFISSAPSASITVSSAPDIPTFSVPDPSMNDPYPGYYQLPSGEWRQHDSEYYEKFRKRWEKSYNDHVRALEKGAVKGFEGYDRHEMADVDAAKEMERAKIEIKEREERKAISKNSAGELAKPKMNITAAKLSGRARSRHQLATLLNEAYENRDALEEKIAEGRRNRKEAGNKYGVLSMQLIDLLLLIPS
ncbi:mitotic checkpoint regulator, MAD2B-interacting-domain-containing protein [Lentinula lateritia]|uniref:Mitotic checkpoint regulator, MAD2B-interacting-domain-containing protein n=1 Tax=Lentinula aff. lateritia TaxID=2804960 RepID=A0ACC1U7V1_9AGAR|nr:mitotic checkpoint regulator, MAD2B-interacting-domain-containing protein [Lentinula aff. lateritia]KAJ3855888.1 mitotic checkpoint regulator, MAD2B-interacting-domain-containing protein [Lentinula lateritia]